MRERGGIDDDEADLGFFGGMKAINQHPLMVALKARQADAGRESKAAEALVDLCQSRAAID